MTTRAALSLAQLVVLAETVAKGDLSRESEERWDLVDELARRGGPETLAKAHAWSQGSNRLLRCLGADVLTRIASRESGEHLEETRQVLDRLLSDIDLRVLITALTALGHLGGGDLSKICKLARHSSEEVREAAVAALTGRDELLALQTLVALSGDPSPAVRSAATFGLGSPAAVEDAALAGALEARLREEDDEIRGEALVALARRGDAGVVPLILQELRRESVPMAAIRAAGLLPRAEFVPELERLLAFEPDDVSVSWALDRCLADEEGAR